MHHQKGFQFFHKMKIGHHPDFAWRIFGQGILKLGGPWTMIRWFSLNPWRICNPSSTLRSDSLRFRRDCDKWSLGSNWGFRISVRWNICCPSRVSHLIGRAVFRSPGAIYPGNRPRGNRTHTPGNTQMNQRKHCDTRCPEGNP